jgi:hypothetical protein
MTSPLCAGPERIASVGRLTTSKFTPGRTPARSVKPPDRLVVLAVGDLFKAVPYERDPECRVSFCWERERTLMLALCEAVVRDGIICEQEVVLRDGLSGVLRYVKPDLAQGTDR